jgi:hypothetical protein
MKWLYLLVVPSVLIAGVEDLSIQTVMTPEEQEATGLNRASDEQKKAFEAWLSSWTLTVIKKAPTYHPSLTLSTWVQNWKKKPAPGQQNDEPLVIFRNKNGETIELSDGSIFEIIPIDRKLSIWWKRGEAIDIHQSTRDISRPYTLKNSPRNQEAGARLISAAPPNKKPKEDPNYFKDAISIKTIGLQGATITLVDGTLWKIAPLGQAFVVANWQPFDRVRIEPSSDMIYKYKILNLDSGDEVLAKK